MLVNREILRKNKKMRKANRLSLKKIGKERDEVYFDGVKQKILPPAVIKTKIGKISQCVGFCDDPFLENYSHSGAGFLDFSQVQFLEVLKNSELRGFGAGFPVYDKVLAFLSCGLKDKIILINGVECESGLHNDSELIFHHFHFLDLAAGIIANALGLGNGFEKERVFFAAKGFPLSVSANCCKLVKVPARYPVGEEHILIRQIFGQSLAKNDLPAEKGILVLNVQTVYAIYKLLLGAKIDGKFVTLTDVDEAVSQVVFVKYGENIRKKLIDIFGDKKDISNVKIFAGIGNFNVEEAGDDVVFSPFVAFAAMASTSALLSNDFKCKGCGKCQRKCPVKLPLKKIVALKEKNIFSDLDEFNTEDCLRCGACAFFCSASKIPFEYFQKS